MATANITRKKDFWYYFHSIITIFIMFGFGYLPLIEPLTPMGMEVLGIFIGLLYGWIMVEMIWPSLLSLLALGMTDYTTVLGAFTRGFGDNITLMIFFMLIFAAYLEISGLNQTIANWFVTRKIIIGRPWVLITMILLAAYVMAATISIYGTIIILWTIFYKICDSFGYKAGDKFVGIVLVGIVFADTAGSTAFLYKPFAMLVMGIVTKVSAVEVNFMGFAIVNIITSCIFIMLYVLACKYLIKPDVSALMNKENTFYTNFKKEAMPQEQKIAACFLALFMFVMFAPSVLPKTWALQQLLARWGTLGCIVFTVILVCALQLKGKKVAMFAQLAKQGMMWELIILFAATMPVSAAMESPDSGVMDALVMVFTPILSNLSPTVFVIVAAVIASIVTQFAHNMVLAVIFTPLFTRMAIEVGADPLIFGVILMFVLQMAMVTPGSSAQSAMIHTNLWVSKKQAYLYTLLGVVVTVLIVLIVIPIIGPIFL